MVKRFSNVETSRKTIHILLFLVWCLIDYFYKGTIHQVIIPCVFILLNFFSYRFSIYKSIERESENHLGTVYFAIAVTFVMTVSFFLPEFYFPGGAAIFCLTFGDGFAALLGYNFKSKMILQHKSRLGFLACVIGATVALLAFKQIYHVNLGVPAVVLLGLFAGILELTGGGLDNFTITLGTFFLSCGMMRDTASSLVESAAAAIIIFLIVFFSSAIDYYGSLLAMAMVFAFSFFGGRPALLYLLTTYFVIFFVSVFKHKVLGAKKEGTARTWKQIAINGGLGTGAVILYGLTGKPAMLLTGMVSIGGCFVDSLSSDIGVLAKRKPYDPIKRKYVEAGMSGGMTVLGTSAALAGSLCIGVALNLFLNVNWTASVLAAFLIMGQSLLDTCMGSLIQAKYTCSICGACVEEKVHCSAQTVQTGGASWVNNNMVNLLASVTITVVAAFIFRRVYVWIL